MIGIVICNFNKKDYVIKCVRSVLSQDFQDFDLYVVDNASTDGSPEAIRKEFLGERVVLIQNEENLGGSGGFNTGLRECLKKNYEYLMCVDNDVVMEHNAVGELFSFLESHTDVGMAGSKICIMDDPSRIQTYGAVIDFDAYGIKDLHRGCLNDENLPDVQYCDYVPACSLMVRTDAIKKVGIMPEDNFIYWDDMEWGYRFKLAGWEVAAVSASTVFHKGGKAVNPSTFQKYYMFRNRVNFFMKYVSQERRGHFIRTILSELFRSICSCYLKQDFNMLRTFMLAYDDAIHGIRGKAKKGRVLPREFPDRLKELIHSGSRVLLIADGNYQGISIIKNKVLRLASTGQFSITCTDDKNLEKLKQQYPDCQVVSSIKEENYDVLLQMCPHIFLIGNMSIYPGAVCIDQWLNLLITENDFQYAENLGTNQELFIACNEGIMEEYMRASG